MAGRATTTAFISSSGTVSDPRETGALGRMTKPRTTGTVAPENRGRSRT